MNVLVDKFPTKAKLGNDIYNINTDFRVGINIMRLYEDNSLNIYEKTEIMLSLLYEKEIPLDLKEIAIEKAMIFLNAGESDKKNNDANRDGIKTKRLYSFEKDAKYIYSAIKKSTHGEIDLENIEYLHWWKFVYYFLDLDEKSFFSQMIYLRNQKNKGKLSKEEKVVYANLEDILELDNSEDYTEEEQIAINKFMKGLEE